MTENSSPASSQSDQVSLEDLDRRHLIRSMHRGDIKDRVVIVKGEGCTVWDSNGNELLDTAGGGVWSSPIGHGRKELAEAAAAQIGQIEFFTSLMEYSNDKAIKLAAKLVELAPDGINRVAFCQGGSEAVETAIKAARKYFSVNGQPEKNWILARQYAFHGATYGSGTLTGFPNMQDGVGPNLPNVAHLTPPYFYRAGMLYGEADVTDFLVAELEAKIAEIGAENIAAFVGEPIIAAGGVLMPPGDYWPRIREVLRANNILLVADEVVTSMGRTGHWFHSAVNGMEPDIITVAKSLGGGYAPIGAALMTDEIADTIINAPGGFFHGYTFQGHPVSCALALKTIEIIERENLIERAEEIQEWMWYGLVDAKENTPHVGDLRVVGSLCAIELVQDKQTTIPVEWHVCEAVAAEIRNVHGVIARPYGHNLVLAPPLTITEAEINRATAAVSEVLGRLQVDGTFAPRSTETEKSA